MPQKGYIDIKNYRDILEEVYPLQNKSLKIIIPNAGEHPFIVLNTIKEIAETNAYADMEGIANFIVDEIILSDQSYEERAKQNRDRLFTAKDVIERLYGRAIPKIYHLVFDSEMDDILRDYIKEKGFLYHLEQDKPRGKGWNMYVSSLATGRRSDKKNILMFLDAENEQIGRDQVIAMGRPVIHENSNYRFIKAAFDRFHREEGEMHLGGRVNVHWVAFINMLSEKDLMKPIYYPCAGEITIERDLLWDLSIPRKYGVEMGVNIQLLNTESGLLTPDEYLQVHLGKNMDQPLGEGQSMETIYEKCDSMTRDIALTVFGLMGDDIKKIWKTPKALVSDFEKYQDRSIKIWLIRGKSMGGSTKITGGIDAALLKKRARDVIYSVAADYYSRRLSKKELGKEFMLPVHKLEEILGENEFYGLIEYMTSKKTNI